MLSEATDPNLLYEVQTRLAGFPVYTEAEANDFARIYFDPKTTLDRLYSALAPMVERFRALAEDEREDFRGQLTDYVRLYALPIAGPDLHRRRPRKALRLRPAFASAAARRPRRTAA